MVPGSDPNSVSFEITDANRETGTVTLVRQVDYELVKTIDVIVTAVDSGAPALTSTATVVVSVEDVNDNTPTWITDFTDPVDIWENETYGKDC